MVPVVCRSRAGGFLLGSAPCNPMQMEVLTAAAWLGTDTGVDLQQHPSVALLM